MISVYRHSAIEQRHLIKELDRLRVAFPDITEDLFALLINEIKERGISNEWLTDAITNVIFTHVWSSPPRLAYILGYEKRVKTFTYNQVCDHVSNGEKWANFERYGDFYVYKKDNKLF